MMETTAIREIIKEAWNNKSHESFGAFLDEAVEGIMEVGYVPNKTPVNADEEGVRGKYSHVETSSDEFAAQKKCMEETLEQFINEWGGVIIFCDKGKRSIQYEVGDDDFVTPFAYLEGATIEEALAKQPRCRSSK